MIAAINFRGAGNYEDLQALFAASPEACKKNNLPPLILFRILIPIVNAYEFFRHILVATGALLSGKVTALHLLRRALHVLSFGLIFYPASSQGFAALPFFGRRK
jgi:hypothetical protein